MVAKNRANRGQDELPSGKAKGLGEPPASLDKEAREHWSRLARLLEDAKLAKPFDADGLRMLLAMASGGEAARQARGRGRGRGHPDHQRLLPEEPVAGDRDRGAQRNENLFESLRSHPEGQGRDEGRRRRRGGGSPTRVFLGRHRGAGGEEASGLNAPGSPTSPVERSGPPNARSMRSSSFVSPGEP
jgi:hypothetical protein